MTDHQLSTRDLATRSDTDADSSMNVEPPPAERDAATRSAGDEGILGEAERSDEPPTRDRAENKPQADEQLGQAGSNEPAAYDDPAGSITQAEPEAAQASAQGDDHDSLLPSDQSERFTERWQEIQTSFVDQPRDSVAQADALVADLMQRLAASFSNERERLEAQWDRGDDVSTEDLRVALTRYRSFFDRLLSA